MRTLRIGDVVEFTNGNENEKLTGKIILKTEFKGQTFYKVAETYGDEKQHVCYHERTEQYLYLVNSPMKVTIKGVRTESLLSGQKSILPENVIDKVYSGDAGMIIDNLWDTLGMEILMIDNVCTRRMMMSSVAGYVQSQIQEGKTVNAVGVANNPMTLVDTSMTFEVTFERSCWF